MSVKVTVVTVTYNCAGIVEETIKSVIGQDYDNLEYIIIDGASSDGTWDIVNRYADRITYMVSEPDKGIYDAMNKGIDAATGRWINFMNAGDVFASSTVLSEVFAEPIGDDVGFVFGKSGGITSKGYRTPPEKLTPFYESKDKFHNMGFNHQAAFARTDIAKRLHFDLSFRTCADYNMMASIVKAGYRGEYRDVTVAVTEGREGFSADNRRRQRYEEALICGSADTLTFRIIDWWRTLKETIKKIIGMK